MSLVFKSSVRENIKDINTFIVDTSQRSANYFRVSDIPQVLQKGKNLLRITAHPTNLVEGSQVYVDVRDSNGNPIYYEIPDYLEDDKSRVISIWIYHDKGDDNTPNGDATITIAGIANVDLNGNQLPEKHRGKINVKWETTVNVDRDRANTSEVIFDSKNLPIVTVSQSIESYENQPQAGEQLNLTSQTGKVTYISRGDTPIIQTKDGSTFNSEMVSGSIILNNFTEDARPLTTIENPLSSTFFSSSIKEILSSTVLKPNTHFTTSFSGREDVIHTFDFIGEADYNIQYFRSGSNVSTENKRNFVNLTLTNVDPITGVVDKVRILQKSDGLPGDFELLNEVSVPFSSSINIKAPIPSKNLKDPKILKLLYLNSQGGISRTETISSPFVFDGENIYIGGSENLISGSIFISNTLGTGIEIGGASSGFIRSVGFEGQTSASLGKAPGGFVIYSGSGNLQMGEDTLDGVGVQFIGDNDDRHFIFTTDNGGLLDVKTDKFFIGTENTQFISGSDGNIEISSSIFHLDPEANLLVIGSDAQINADLSVNNIFAPAGTNILTAKAAIKSDGFAKFVSASIGGWDITTSSIEGGNLIMKPEGILQTRDFASGLQGWKISSEGNGTAEFENIRIRGTLRTTTFEKESVNAVGGQLWVANSTTLTGSTGANDVTMSVKNASGFSAGEILLIKKVNNTGFQTEYVLLNSASIDGDGSNEDERGGRIMVTRAYGSGSGGNFVGDLASASQSYDEGQVIVSTGKINTGYIKMNANPNDTATPFIDIVERTGSGLYDVALKARLGDLGGLANSSHVFGNSNPGFGLATENVFLQGGIIANTGSIGGINMDAGKLFTGEGQYNNSNTGFYVDSGSQFSLGTKLVWNPSTEALVIRGQLQLSDGTDVGTAIESVSTPTGSQARIVTLSADKYVVTFDADGNESPGSQVIGLTASAQNFGLSTVYYEFYKNQSLQGSRGTSNLFEVNTVAEKPTASAPVTYEVRVFTQSSAGDTISSDSLTLFGIQPGSDGTDGTDAVTALLTNESHTFPADTSGNIASFVGGTTDMQVFEGVTDKTSQYVISSSNGVGMTATDDGNTVTITGMSHDSGSVKITATSASVSLDKTMSLSKAKTGTDGAAGASASLISLTGDSQVFAFPSASATTPEDTTIELFVTQQNLGKTLTASDITITDVDGTSLTVPTFAPSTLSNNSGIISGSLVFGTNTPNGSNKNKFPITITATSESLSDTFKVFALDGGADGAAGADGTNGTDAITVILSNESHTIAAASDGTVASFSGAETDVTIFEGVTDKTSNYFINGVSNTGVTVDNDFNSFNSSSLNVTAMSHDSGSVIITSISGGVPHTGWGAGTNEDWATSQFVTNNQGDINGTDNDFFLVSDPDTISVGTGDGELRNNYVQFGDNSGDDEVWIVGKDIFAYDDTKTYYIEARFKRVAGSGTVFVGVNGWSNETTKVNKGGNNTFGSQHYIAASDFAFGDGEGSDWVTMRGYFSGHSSTGGENTGQAPDINNPKSIHTNATYISPMFLANYNDSAGTIRLDYLEIKEVKDGSGNLSAGTVKVDKTMTLAKSKAGTDGAAGSNAKLVTLTSDSQVFTFASASVTTPDDNTIELFFNQQNLSGTIAASDVTITDQLDATYTVPTLSPSSLSNGTGVVSGSLVFSTNTPSNKNKFPITISVTKDGVTDSTKIFTLDGGADGSDGTAGEPAKSVALTATSQIISYNAAGSSPDVASITLTATSQNFTNGYFKFTGGGGAFSDESSYTDGSGANSDTATFTVPSSYSSTPYTFTVSVQEGDSGGEVASDTITIASVQPGAQGADAFTVVLTNESHTLTQTSPQAGGTIDFAGSGTEIIAYKGTTQLDSVSGTPGSGEFKVTATGTNITPGSINVSGNNAIVADHSSMSSVSASIGYDINLENTVTLAKSQSFSISQAADSGSDGAAGADAYTVIVSNESHTIPQSSAQAGGALNFAGSGTNIIVYKGTTELQHTNSTPGSEEFKVTASGTNITPGSISNPSRPAVIADHSGMNETSASIAYTVNVENSATFTKNQSFTISQAADSGSDGATGPEGPNFDFLTGSLETVNTSGGLSAGLLMTSKVFGFHGDITEGDGTNATLGDFTSYLDHSGSFYLGGGESGASTPSGGYFAWNNNDKSLLISGSNAEVKVDKFFFGAEDTQFLSGSNGNVEISGSNFHLDRDGNVKVSGEITVTNTADFAGNSWIDNFNNTPTATNYYLGNVTTALATTSDAGNTFDGIKVNNSSYYGGFTGGFITKTTFAKANEPTFVIDVILNDGNGPGNRTFERPIGSVGFTNVAANGDITTTSNLDHLMAGFRFHSAEHDGNYYNQISIYDNGSAVRTYSDETGNELEADEAWTEGTDTKWRFTIKLLAGGGATYRAYKNGDFVTPIMTHTTSTNIGTDLTAGVLVEMASAAIDYLYVENMSVGAGLPQSTTISGNAISTGKIQSSNLSTSVGSELDLNAGTIRLGGTSSPKFAVNAAGALTASAGTIGGVNIDTSKIYVGTGTVNNSNTGFYLDDSGNFSLKDKLYWNGSTLAITGNITVSNPSDFADPNADDSTTAAVFNKIISPATQTIAADGRPAGFFAAYRNNTTTTVISTDLSDGNGKILDLYSSEDNTIGVAAKAVETQDDVTYKIKLTFKASSADADGLYVRVYELDALTGTDDYGTSVSFTNGTLKAISHTSNSITGEAGVVPNTRQKTTSFTNVADGSSYTVENGPVSSTYVTIEGTYTPTATAQLFSVNVLNWAGMGTKHLYIKDLQVIPLGVAQGTQIGGDNIRTGEIKSLNLSQTQGSVINLDTGSMKMGGTANPGFEVTQEGFVTATNMTEKFVLVTDANSGSYFEYYVTGSGSTLNGTRLLLDGSGGGNVTMNLNLESAPQYVISDLKFPSSVGTDALAEMELKISTDVLVQFDDASVTSGLSTFGGNLLQNFLNKGG